MSKLLERLKALRGDAVASSEPEPAKPDPKPATYSPAASSSLPVPVRSRELSEKLPLERAAVQLNARLVHSEEGVHLAREVRHSSGARHGSEPLGGAGLHPLLMRQAGEANERLRPHGHVLYIDTETTGLAGGTGTLAFLIGVGIHRDRGFEVSQLFLPGPEQERSQLAAFAALASGASAVVSYNGASFDVPLLRNRFALHRMPNPLEGLPHLDLLAVARRLWRESLPDCTLSTVERRILGARRGLNDVPGSQVPARYTAFLRSNDASGLQGVLEHNVSDIVALTALRARVERLIEDPSAAREQEAHGLGVWMERLGEEELALGRYMQAARAHREAGWRASLLLKKMGRLEHAASLWFLLGRQGMAAAWVELAKAQEHRWRDYDAALESVAAAEKCRDCGSYDLEKRRVRLQRRLGGSSH